jgi:hypothetical protein
LLLKLSTELTVLSVGHMGSMVGGPQQD